MKEYTEVCIKKYLEYYNKGSNKKKLRQIIIYSCIVFFILNLYRNLFCYLFNYFYI